MAAALARLAEQITGARAEIEQTRRVVESKIEALDRLTDAKFVTFRTLIDAQAEKVALALAAADKAVSKAETATEKRFESVNEFRGQLNDQSRQFMPRSEADQLVQQLTQRVRELADAAAGFMPRTEASVLFDRNGERIQEIADRLNRNDGQTTGAKDNKAGLYAALAILTSVIVAVVIVANFLAK